MRRRRPSRHDVGPPTNKIAPERVRGKLGGPKKSRESAGGSRREDAARTAKSNPCGGGVLNRSAAWPPILRLWNAEHLHAVDSLGGAAQRRSKADRAAPFLHCVGRHDARRRRGHQHSENETPGLHGGKRKPPVPAGQTLFGGRGARSTGGTPSHNRSIHREFDLRCGAGFTPHSVRPDSMPKRT